MNTPTPGDLSARHVAVLRHVVDAFKAMHSPFNHDYVKDEKCCERCKLLKKADEAIAALSALPAAGVAWRPIASVPRDGTRVVVWMPDGTFSSASYSAHSEPQGVYWMIPTTTQPSAAEDAAVGAQGEDLARLRKYYEVTQHGIGMAKMALMRNDPSGAAQHLTNLSDEIDKAFAAPADVGAQGEQELEDAVAQAIADVIGHRMAEKCEPHARAAIAAMRSASPAAGKGVDDASGRELSFYLRWALGVIEDHGLDEFALTVQHMHAEATVALTRQPVAGDGWIRVIERAAETLDDLGAPLNAAELRALVSIESKPDKAAALSELRELMDITDPVERNDALVTFFRANGDMGRHGDAMCWTPEQTARHYLAPAATPTDGGEGKS